MESESASLAQQLLPRVRGQRTQAVGTKTQFYSNLFRLTLQKSKMAIYQYSVEVEPAVAHDSTELMRRIAHSLWGDLKKETGYFAHKGYMLWGLKDAKKVLTLTAEFARNGEEFKYAVLVKPTCELGVVDFAHDNPDQIGALCQVLNIYVKQRLRGEAEQRSMVELNRGVFFKQDEVGANAEKGVGLSVWRGHRVTVVPNNGQLFLQVDAISRVLSMDNFLEVLEQDRRKLSLPEISSKHAGSTVLNKKGNMRVYHVDGIDFDKNPKHKFTDSKTGEEVSFIEYFLNRYGYKVRDQKQPLVRVKVRSRANKEETTCIYLIPEMLVQTGMSEAQRKDHKVMKQLDRHTKLRPQDRMEESQYIIDELTREQGMIFEVSRQPEQIPGLVLEAPYVRVGKGKTVDTSRGSINLRHVILEPHKFADWLFVYSIGKDPDYDQDDADFALDNLKKAGQTFGIAFSEPNWVEVEARNFGDWERALEGKAKKLKSPPSFVVYFLQGFERGHYERLKMLTFAVLGCPSQVVQRRILSRDNKKGVLSCASKIALQMNAKMGHPIWFIENKHKFWHTTGQKVAVGSIAVSRAKQGSAISFVGTTDDRLIRYLSAGDMVRSREALSAAFYETLFTSWVKEYFIENGKTLPGVIVIYREGLNDVQARSAFQEEVKGLNLALDRIRKKSKIADYQPRITYVLVNKKPNERMFEKSSKEFLNPGAGSIVFEDLSRDSFKEFHLASVQVSLGSCTPVSFKVGFETYDTPMDALAEMTYNQCYGYWNWQGPVRVPATLQYANKLCKTIADSGSKFLDHLKSGNLKNKLFYL